MKKRIRRHSPDKTRVEFLCDNAEYDAMYRRSSGRVPEYIRGLIAADRRKHERKIEKFTVQ